MLPKSCVARARLKWGVSALALSGALFTSAAFAQDAATASATKVAQPAQVTSAPAAQASATKPSTPGTPAEQQSTSGIQTIVVTSELRKENVQRVPIAITAVNAAMLEARSQTNVVDVANQTPNVTLRPANAAFGSSLIAFIRGVGQTDFNYSTEPGVGVYVDDVYYATITGNLLDLLDLDRVEVLRGPQGTLSGRNAIGGVIKLYTKQPTGDGGGFLEGTYGSFNRVDFRGGADFTVVPDKLFVRIAGVSRSRDGYVTRVDYACEHHSPAFGQPGGIPSMTTLSGCKLGTEGGQSYTGGRIAARWVATDNIDVNVAFDMINDRSEVQAGVAVLIPTGVPAAAGGNAVGGLSPVPVYYDNNGNGSYDAGIDVPLDNRFQTGGTFKSYATFNDDGKSAPDLAFAPAYWGPQHALTVPPINFFKGWGTSVTIDWKLADNLTAKYIAAYRYYTNIFAEDTGGAPLASQLLLQRLVHREWTQEGRLNGTFFNGFADWVAGGFYLEQRGAEDASVDLPFAGLDFTHGPDHTPSKSYAGFSDVIFHPFDKVSLAVGGRYSHDEKTYVFNRHNMQGLYTPGAVPGTLVPVPADLLPEACTIPAPGFVAGQPTNCSVAGLTGLSSSFSSNRWDYRAALNFQWTPDIMTYIQTSTGYKGGGVNARPFYPAQLHSFAPETITSYEGGLKSTLFEKARFNVAGFYNLYKGIQLAPTLCTFAGPGPAGFFPPYFPCAAQENIGDAHVYGAEVETEIHPFEGAEIDASYSYIHFEYTRLLDPLSSITKKMITPLTPTNKYSIGAQYEMPLPGNMGSFTPRVDWSYQTTVYTSALNAASNKIAGYGVTNLRFTWKNDDQMWSAAAEVTNLFDKYYYLTLFDNTQAGGNQVDGQPARPREFAFTVKRKF